MDLDAKNWLKETPLERAAERGHESGVEILVGQGADVQNQSVKLVVLYKLQRLSENFSEILILLQAGPEVNARGRHYRNALQAASMVTGKNVKLLIKHGAKVDVYGGEYGNALQRASLGGHETIERLLIKKRGRFYCLRWAFRTCVASDFF